MQRDLEDTEEAPNDGYKQVNVDVNEREKEWLNRTVLSYPKLRRMKGSSANLPNRLMFNNGHNEGVESEKLDLEHRTRIDLYPCIQLL